jgi:hypothetical protein
MVKLKLPKRGERPVVGWRMEDPYSCAYVIGLASGRKPIRIRCGGVNPQRHFKELQRAQPDEIELRQAFWLPDLRLARRVVSEARAILRDRLVRDDWFDVTAAEAAAALIESAKNSRVPLLTNQEYRRICVSPAKERELRIENTMRFIGMSTRSRRDDDTAP